MTRTFLRFDRSTRDRLRKAYEAALESKAETFEFQGRELFLPYAKYVLEYLDTKFEK